MSRGVSRITASPVMIGALTVIIAVLAVFLAYNANSGLPFTPTYKLSTQVENANTLVPGNEVRIGGVRVGQIEAIEPVANGGRATANAKLDLKLDPEVEPLPVDSTVIVRSRSALGIKYLEIVPGKSEEGYEAGSLMPLSAATPEPVEHRPVPRHVRRPHADRDPDQPARVRQHLRRPRRRPQLGDRRAPAAGRAPAPRRHPDRLARRRSSTDLFPALAQAAAEVAPVAQTQADMFVGLDETFKPRWRASPARSSRRRSRARSRPSRR